MSSCQELIIRISRIEVDACDIPLPRYATDGSSGMDIHAAVLAEITIDPGETALVPTGLRVEIPQGYEAQVRPRSGLAYKYGVTVLNTPGTIDADYRGEIKVLLVNLSGQAFVIANGERIAQMIVTAHARVDWEISNTLAETIRGIGGFGHTGTK